MSDYKLLRAEEIAELCNVTPNVVRHWAYWRYIGHIKISNRLYFRKEDLDEFLKYYFVPADPEYSKFSIMNS